MKKLSILFLALFLGIAGFAQKKSGTVYSEHKYIDKARDYWQAFANLDKDALLELCADTVYTFINGNSNAYPKEQLANGLNWWSNVENLNIKDYPSTSPDAIEYSSGEIWVQAWFLVTGVHKETGIYMEIMLHNMFKFDDKGKISQMVQDYKNDVMELITDNLTPSENGTIYMNHPYITSVRKLINAYRELDIDKWETFFAPSARFSNTTMKPKEFNGIEKQREELKKAFANTKEIRLEPVGYPDCLHYNKEDNWCVLSWWNVYGMTNDGHKFEYPMQYQHWFNKDGKISSETMYYSSNHFE